MTKSDVLRPRQASFVAAMLAGKNVTEAAESVGVRRQTAHRWLAQPAVQRALDRAVDDTMRIATRRAAAAMGGAVQALEKILDDPKASTTAKVSAARAVLDAAPRLREAVDLAERVHVLEEGLGHDRN